MTFTIDTKLEELPKKFRGPFRRWKNYHSKPIEDHFWPKVKVGTVEECWEWIGDADDMGYGSFTVRNNGVRKRMKAHRLAWILTNGHIPDGLYVCHHCDNPPCCNPNHLFVGTPKQNMEDCGQKKRHFSADGEKSARHILTDFAVLEIRRRYHPGKTTAKMLAVEFGVSFNTINGIIARKRWKHLPIPDHDVKQVTHTL